MKCPGQDMQYWTAAAIYEVECPKCAKSVEFYKDDTTRSCSHCGHRFVNPKMDFGCAAYCKFAEQCIGTLPEEFVGTQDNLLKDKVAVEIKRFYKNDFKRIGHLTRIARYAEKIASQEGVNLAIVLCAAYLKDIDSDASKAQASAQSILENLGANDEIRNEVCALLEALKTGQTDVSQEAKSLADADSIAMLEERNKEQAIDEEQFERFISKDITTESGRTIARSVFSHLAVS
ncbi:MAG: phosphohydrolase [Desulfofustis sp.]|nr:phosphohydrolase [Desulfofustis sp.]NNF45332.1 phosphohydrolase [Desulfofustis sp.]